MTTRAEPANANRQVLSEKQRRAVLRPLQLPGWKTLVGLVVFVALVAWASSDTEVSVSKLLKGIPNIWDYIKGLWPPDRSYWKAMWPAIRITLEMALVGTVLSVIIAFPVGLLAARNTTPHVLVYQAVRLVLNMLRGINQVVWAFVIVGAVGFGPFAGVLALAIGGLGTLGKLYAEAIESISPRPIEALRAT